MALILKVEGYAVRKPAICSVLFLVLISLIQVLFSADSIGEYIQRSDLSSRPSLDPAISQGQAVKAALNFGRMPLHFIANRGQMDERVAYYIRGKDKTVYFAPEGLTIALNGPSERWVLKLDFVGANPRVKPSGMKKTCAVVSYFKGKPEDWQTGVATYSKIVYEDLWPGIDLVYSGNFGKLKCEFIVHPGADPSLIRLAYRGTIRLEVTAKGALKIETPLGTFHDGAPLAYQEINGRRVDVSMGFRLDERLTDDCDTSPGQNEPGARPYTYGFSIGEYDRTQPLVLDPVLIIYCGYIGASLDDKNTTIAVDTSGNAYVAGETYSDENSFPVVTGPDLNFDGTRDAFVAKVNASGTALVCCGYIGGASDNWGSGIALDSSGHAYVTGHTFSSQASFPVTVGPDITFSPSSDAYIAKVNTWGTALAYCGYIGGGGDDDGRGIALDQAHNAYIIGTTSADESTFPVTVGPDLTYNGDIYDAFVAKIHEEPIWKPRHAVGDFDGDGSDEAAVDFGTAGIYLYDGGSWTQLSASNPESLVAADADGDTVAELLANLGASGLWLCNGGTWSQLSGVNADYVDCADLDGSGGEEIVGDFGAIGLWVWNTGAWTQLSGVNADYMVFGDANGLTGEELFGDFGWAGLWLWSSAGGWTQLSGLDLDFMGIMQADGDAQNEFVGDFGAAGMSLWDEGTWVQSTGADADFLIILDVDGDAVDEGVVDFGSLGVWLGSTSSDWVQLSGVNAEYMMAGMWTATTPMNLWRTLAPSACGSGTAAPGARSAPAIQNKSPAGPPRSSS